jgi:FkbM family methyltransferase
LFTRRDDEVFVDCGAFDGDTIRAMVESRLTGFRSIVALEPDPANFTALRKYVDRLPEETGQKIALHEAAVAARSGTLCFQASGTASSTASPAGAITVNCVALDELLADASPSFIKMDIEGGEIDALEGSRRTIERSRPVLAISVYHRQDHLWRIPLLLRSMCEEYGYYLRPHDEETWDLVCYAVPSERLVR